MGGYDAIMYRLSGVLPFGQGSPSDDLETLERALSAYFFDDVSDDITHEMIWRHFVIPSLLLVLQDHLSSDPFRVRLNEYFFQYLEINLPDPTAREEAVLGLLAVLIESANDHENIMEHDVLAETLYDIFPNLSSFVSRVTPTQSPFVSSPVNLNALAHFMAAIQVKTYVFFFNQPYFSLSTGFPSVSWMNLPSTGVDMLGCGC